MASRGEWWFGDGCGSPDKLSRCSSNGSVYSEIFTPYNGTSTTQEQYGTFSTEFVGEFADIRQQVDLSYHGNYVAERQEFQDGLVRQALGKSPSQESPWLVFMAGAMAVGKTYALSWLKEQVDLSSFVVIDPDIFTSSLPEVNQLSADSVGQATRVEVRFSLDKSFRRLEN